MPDVNRNLIEAFLESGQYEAAMKTYLLLDDKQRELPEVKFALGRIYLFQNEADSAIKVFEALYAIRDAENADFWMELATCYHRFGATERAIQILEQGAKECLDTSQINIQLAHLYFGLNRTFDAIGVYELLKSEQPGSLQINAELATLYFLAIQENRYNGQINRFDLNQKISECSRICYDFQASNSEEYYLIGQVYYINRLFRKAEYFYNQSFVLSEGGHAKPYYDAFIVL